jgi:hypothetical protein
VAKHKRRKKSDCLLFQIDGGGKIGLNAHVRDAAPDSPGKSMPGLCLAITRKAMAHDRNAYPEERLSFPKIQSGGIRAVRENQRIIRCDVCDRPPACNVYSRSVQVTTPA